MVVQRVTLASEVGKRVVGVSIAVAGLLIARLVVAALPMLKNAPSIGNTGIHPLAAGKVILDTLTFVVLLRFGAATSSLLRSGYRKLADSGPILNLTIITLVVALAYNSYGGLIRPLLGESESLYGWLFLVLGIAPVAAIVVLVLRNIDTITELVFRSTHLSSATIAFCANCGCTIEPGTKFCPQCGLPADASPKQGKCPSCGAENTGTAKFCKECGKPLAV